MDSLLNILLNQNKNWARTLKNHSVDFFIKLAKAQKPKVLWIGCSDSRVAENTILGLKPGEVFVHRNIANVVQNTDISLLSVLEYGIHVLKIPNVVICGHSNCGGIKAALDGVQGGITEQWLHPIREVYFKNLRIFKTMSKEEKIRKVTQLHIKEAVFNIAKTSIVQQAWRKNKNLAIHGWMYNIQNGIIEDQKVTVENKSSLHKIFHYSED